MGRRSKDSHLSSIPEALLRAEIARRQRASSQLINKRKKLLAKLADLDAQIRAAGAAVSGAGGRVRPRNETNLTDAMRAVLKGKTMGVSEVAEAVVTAGYRTNAANFRVIVNQTLLKNKSIFKKLGRGRYTAN
jgi:hypothetical protein